MNVNLSGSQLDFFYLIIIFKQTLFETVKNWVLIFWELAVFFMKCNFWLDTAMFLLC